MTEKEKARELFDKVSSIIFDADRRNLNMDVERRCAIAIVDEMLSQYYLVEHESDIRYWEEVKQELLKM